jgi:hypothetical protein
MGGYTKSRVIGRLSLGTSAKGREAMASLRRSATSSPKLSVIRSVAEALDVTIGDLVGELTLLEWNSESGTKTVSALREALLNYRQLSPFAQPAAGGAPDINQLTTAVGSLYSPVLPTRTRVPVGLRTLLLAGSVAAARAEDRSSVQQFLNEADETARRIRRDGPTAPTPVADVATAP